jgi:hypothetical protein
MRSDSSDDVALWLRGVISCAAEALALYAEGRLDSARERCATTARHARYASQILERDAAEWADLCQPELLEVEG